MNIEIIQLVFGLTQIFANNVSDMELFYSQNNSDLMFQNIISKLHTILMDNRQINKHLVYLNKRLDAQELSHQNMRESKDMNKLKHKEGTWTVIQRRQDGSVDFNRSSEEYEKGFGWPNGEFFIGLEKLHALTTNGDTQELWIVLKDFDGASRYAIYDKFVVGSAADLYYLKELGSYRGTAGNSLYFQKGQPFSTVETGNCGVRFGGGWWFKNGDVNYCYECNLNGPYFKGKNPTGGVAWKGFRAWNYSLKFVEMLIRSIP